LIPKTCAAETANLAYIQNKKQEPMRAWRCHGNTHREMVNNLASVSIE
jgi:hypothetical protein